MIDEQGWRPIEHEPEADDDCCSYCGEYMDGWRHSKLRCKWLDIDGWFDEMPLLAPPGDE